LRVEHYILINTFELRHDGEETDELGGCNAVTAQWKKVKDGSGAFRYVVLFIWGSYTEWQQLLLFKYSGSPPKKAALSLLVLLKRYWNLVAIRLAKPIVARNPANYRSCLVSEIGILSLLSTTHI
jgi:hypothetical protein